MFFAVRCEHARRTGDRCKHYMGSANAAVAIGVAGYQVDFGGYGGECLGHQPAVEADHVGGLVNLRACGRKRTPPAWRQDTHALTFEYAERHLMQALDLVIRKHPCRDKGIAEVPIARCPGPLCCCCGSPRRFSSASSHARSSG